ncbi:MAG: hypothetical protein RLZZ422_1017 [Pseudomonadota bacterium]
MKAAELDQVYTELCYTLNAVGEDKTPLFLAMLSLSLMSRLEDSAEAIALIRQAWQQIDATG